ncbi:MAG: hypothetical protein GWN55_13705 [Phycisphaerae bacterium]|nr:hypothetical protein [Phycisphaerae bacterium]NIV02349.1 hypothetical protein [Phycisphaerae bacterium]
MLSHGANISLSDGVNWKLLNAQRIWLVEAGKVSGFWWTSGGWNSKLYLSRISYKGD